MKTFEMILLLLLIVCAVCVCLTKNLITAVVIYMSFSMIAAVIWITLGAPDLAITEAAVGAGGTTLLFFAALKKMHAINRQDEEEKDESDS